ncbi:MAG TPA: hypothetical protein PKU96_04425 [bacterium]|nr:hypothetical protein [bacterium]
MSYFKERAPSGMILFMALLGLIVAAGFTKISGYDIWWHLKTGEIIFNTRQIPLNDIFSYTAMGNPWVNHEWLFQVMAWLLYSKIGLSSLTLLQFGIVAAMSIFLYSTFLRTTESKIAAMFGTALTTLSVADRVMMRPFLIGLMLTAYFLFRLHSYVTKDKGSLFELPFLTILWVNVHAGGMIGPSLILAFAAGESLQRLIAIKTKWGAQSPSSPDIIRKLWLVGITSTVAAIINPFGTETYTFSTSHFQMKAILSFTQEWIPVLDPRLDGVFSQILFRILLLLTPLSFVVNRRSARLSHLGIWVIASMMVLKGRRFTADYAIMMTPIIFLNFRTLAGKFRVTAGAENLRRWGSVLIVSVISLIAVRDGIPATIRGGTAGELGLGIVSNFPSGTADFLEREGIHGRMFNEMGLGGYLIFRRWPKELVFIDGRTPVYGDEFYLEYMDIIQNPRNLEALLKKYGIDYMVFNAYQAWSMRHMHRYISTRPDWKLVYATSHGFVYLKDKPEYREKIERLWIPEHPLVEEMKRIGEIKVKKDMKDIGDSDIVPENNRGK